MSYVDGFLLPVPQAKLKEYLRLAQRVSKFFKHGALEYRECAGDDLPRHVASPSRS